MKRLIAKRAQEQGTDKNANKPMSNIMKYRGFADEMMGNKKKKKKRRK